MVETLCSKRRAVSAKVFILFLSKITPLSLIVVTLNLEVMLMFALLQVLGHSHLLDKAIEFDIS